MEVLVRIEKETIRSKDVAIILQISMSSIYRMALSKELNPISGPQVDGYPVNLFLRSDIQALNAKRKAFKLECMRAGKTARFGKPYDNRSCPVQEKIIPRLKQLIEEAFSNTSAKGRISGLELHRQLIKEGYMVGTTTVYKVLHKQLEQRSPVQGRV